MHLKPQKQTLSILVIISLILVVFNLMFVYKFSHLKKKANERILSLERNATESSTSNDELKSMVFNNLHSESSLLKLFLTIPLNASALNLRI